MDWWQAAGLMGTFVATGVGVVAMVWRMLRDLRRECREAHAKIGERITRVRKDLGGEIAQVSTDLSGEIAQLRKDLGGEIAEVRQGQTGLLRELGGVRGELGEIRGELGGIRGELTGVIRSVDTLRQEFRAHVLGSAGAES